jgi:hypothetical protein
MQTPDVKTKLEGIGADGTVSASPAEFAALVRADTALRENRQGNRP